MDPAERLRNLSPAVRADLLKILAADDRVRADAIGKLHARSEQRGLAELLIDLEEDRVFRLHVVEILRRLDTKT